MRYVGVPALKAFICPSHQRPYFSFFKAVCTTADNPCIGTYPRAFTTKQSTWAMVVIFGMTTYTMTAMKDVKCRI